VVNSTQARLMTIYQELQTQAKSGCSSTNIWVTAA